MTQAVRARGVLRSRGVDFWLFAAAVVIAVLPIVVATVRALRRDWIPVGDDAFFVVRARDVFGEHHPLLGTWTSASTTLGTNLNNPGPLLFDVFAPFVRVFGGGAGAAIGAAVLNSLMVVGIAIVAYRRGGPVLGTLATAVTALLTWSMGSELLFDPWQPHALILPFVFFLMLIWAAGTGDLAALPWAAGIGSLLVQSHLSYAFLVPVLAVAGAAGAVLFVYRRARSDPAGWPRLRVRAVRVAAVSGAVLVLCWIQPLIEQFTSDGEGNLSRLARSFGSDVETPGAGWATEAVASVLSLPPFWWRPSFDETFFANTPLRLGDSTASLWSPPATGVAAASLLGLVALLVVCAVFAWRRSDRRVLFALVLSAVGALVGFATVARAPVTVLGNLTPHSARWLWGLGAFMLFAIAASVVRARRLQPYTMEIVAVLLGATALVAARNLPFTPSTNGPQSQSWAIAGVRELRPQLDELEGRGPFLVDGLFDVVFDPYGTAVVAELQRRDLPFVVRDDVLERQLGPSRRDDRDGSGDDGDDGDDADAALVLRIGDGAFESVPGERRVAVYEGLSAAEQDELAGLSDEIATYIERYGPLPLTPRGREALAHGELPRWERYGQGLLDTRELVASREILMMFEHGYLQLDDELEEMIAEYADLQTRWDRRTVGIFVVPAEGAEP
jgi:hypothetical protein